MITIKTLS